MNELPDNNGDEARRWYAQATEDLLTARRILEHQDLPPRTACFLAHLAAEKALKAWLIHADVPFRRTHDLAALHGLGVPAPALSVSLEDLDTLNPWVIDGRYADAGPSPTKALAEDLISAAQRILGAVLDAMSRTPETEEPADG